jgi:hypothetical protein
MATATKPRRARLERGIYRQPNGRLAVRARRAGRLHFRTCDGDAARRARAELAADSPPGGCRPRRDHRARLFVRLDNLCPSRA